MLGTSASGLCAPAGCTAASDYPVAYCCALALSSEELAACMASIDILSWYSVAMLRPLPAGDLLKMLHQKVRTVPSVGTGQALKVCRLQGRKQDFSRLVTRVYLEEKQKSESAQHFANQLEALKSMSVVVADTGEPQLVKKYKPQDCTTNPRYVHRLAVQAEHY